MQVLLVANGVITPGAMLRRLLDSLDAPCVVCADGGALQAHALGLTPRVIIGDLDSLSEEQVAEFRSTGAEVIQHSPDKDETDLELALHYCQQIGATDIHILGGLGGRFDQTIANILLLTHAAFRACYIEVIDGDQVVRLLQPGTHKIDGQSGDTISLIPLGTAADGITTRHLRYPLRGERLLLGPARGISNVMLADRAEVEFRGGLLLLVHTSGRA